jgi:dTDP-4-amino-4,6-dideoxygalactose transaminase
MGWRVPLFEPDFGPEDLKAVQRPLLNGWLTQGATVAELERRFAGRCGVEHAVAVSSCTAALHLSLSALGISSGDEVICPTLTFVATANAIRYVNATPVFCDSVGADNLNVGPEQILRRISPRTRAVIVVHFAGFPVDLVAIEKIVRDRNLLLLEDCAHALFSSVEGRQCGSWGVCGAFSLYSNKNMTCGEGGIITTNDAGLATRLRQLRSHGMTTDVLERDSGKAYSYDVVDVGYNYRMDEIHAGLALAQLDRLDEFLARRRAIRRTYASHLPSSVTLPDFDWATIGKAGDTVGYHILPVILPEGCDRDEIRRRLGELGIQTSVHYRPVHTLTSFSSHASAAPAPAFTEALAARELTLPFYPTMTEEQVKLVCISLRDAVEAVGGSSMVD